MVIARVDCGVIFVVHVTPGAVRALELTAGRRVWLVLKTHSCHLVDWMAGRTANKNSLGLGLRWSSNCGLRCSWHGELNLVSLKHLVLGCGVNHHQIPRGEVAGP